MTANVPEETAKYLTEKGVGALLSTLGDAVLKAKPRTEDEMLVFMRDQLMEDEDIIELLMATISEDARFEYIRFAHSAVDLKYYARTGTETNWKNASALLKRELEETTLPQKIWPAAFAMAEWVADGKLDAFLKGKNIVELGSGVGLAGIVAGAVGAEKVWMTDLSLASLALCKLSVGRLAASLAKRCFVQKLFWGDTADANRLIESLRSKTTADKLFDTVVGADVFYFNNSLKAGLETAYTLLAKGGVFLCASAVRSDTMEDALLAVGTQPRWKLLEEPHKVFSCGKHQGKVHTDFEGILLFKWEKQ